MDHLEVYRILFARYGAIPPIDCEPCVLTLLTDHEQQYTLTGCPEVGPTPPSHQRERFRLITTRGDEHHIIYAYVVQITPSA